MQRVTTWVLLPYYLQCVGFFTGVFFFFLLFDSVNLSQIEFQASKHFRVYKYTQKNNKILSLDLK